MKLEQSAWMILIVLGLFAWIMTKSDALLLSSMNNLLTHTEVLASHPIQDRHEQLIKILEDDDTAEKPSLKILKDLFIKKETL